MMKMDCCKKPSGSVWLLVCGVVVAAILLAVFVLKISLGNIFFYAIFLACPLMHLFMMKHMDHGDKKSSTLVNRRGVKK